MESRSPAAAAAGSPFPLSNLPYGCFSAGERRHHLCVALGDTVVDLRVLSQAGVLADGGTLQAEGLNPFMALGPRAWGTVRAELGELLAGHRSHPALAGAFVPRDGAALHLPFEVADYVDFYSSRHHAENVGRILRPGSPPLHPNWLSLPVGYHGRAGSVVVSGAPVTRPRGQRRQGETVTFGPSTSLDLEAEVGFVVGAPSGWGRGLHADELADHVFGAVLVNDWSARDIQAWEYTPLGPMLGKSFLTSVSPWVVPLAALAGARTTPPVQDPPPLPHLVDRDPWSLDLQLEVRLNGTLIAAPPFAQMYWTPGQQLAHLTSNGSRVRTGDLFASGTVSGPERSQRGSLLELTWNGQEPIVLGDGSPRGFLLDGDTVSITAVAAGAGGTTIGFGSVEGTVGGAD